MTGRKEKVLRQDNKKERVLTREIGRKERVLKQDWQEGKSFDTCETGSRKGFRRETGGKERFFYLSFLFHAKKSLLRARKGRRVDNGDRRERKKERRGQD